MNHDGLDMYELGGSLLAVCILFMCGYFALLVTP